MNFNSQLGASVTKAIFDIYTRRGSNGKNRINKFLSLKQVNNKSNSFQKPSFYSEEPPVG